MPGVGLLVLRMAIGLVTAWQGARLIATADSAWLESGTGLMAILAAAALIVGLLTPFAAALVAIGVALSAARVPIVVTHDGLAHGLVLIDAVSLVLLGPGAFSVDAWLFGPREIHIESYRAPPRE
jgi:uncharacterized membrane protein YphA (DoxX/SURF4 family)